MIVIPKQNTKNPGSILEPKFPIEINAQRISTEAEKLSDILTLYSFWAKRKIVEKNNTTIQTAPISKT